MNSQNLILATYERMHQARKAQNHNELPNSDQFVFSDFSARTVTKNWIINIAFM